MYLKGPKGVLQSKMTKGKQKKKHETTKHGYTSRRPARLLIGKSKEFHNHKLYLTPDTKRKRKKDQIQREQNKQTNARETHRPGLSLPQWGDHNAKRIEKHKNNKEQSKTQHQTPHSNDHEATLNKNNTRTTALERSVA